MPKIVAKVAVLAEFGFFAKIQFSGFPLTFRKFSIAASRKGGLDTMICKKFQRKIPSSKIPIIEILAKKMLFDFVGFECFWVVFTAKNDAAIRFY